MADTKGNIIIIKRVSSTHGGHHGGAWKVAYADFVTAMMAFFLLLWLISTVSHAKLEGISKYFSPDSGIPNEKGVASNTQPNPEAPKSTQTPQDSNAQSSEQAENNYFQNIQQDLKQLISKTDFSNSVILDKVADGLNIQILDHEEPSWLLFKPNEDKLQPSGMALIKQLTKIIKSIPRYLDIIGYTTGTETTYDPWELSARRANSVRLFLLKDGLDTEKIVQLTAKANTEPLDPKKPNLPQNRRVSIILLKNKSVSYQKQNIPEN